MIWPFKRRPVKSRPTLQWKRPDAAFRERSDYVSWAHATLNCPEGQALQAYLFAGVPESLVYRGDQLTTPAAAMEYFRLVGYLECLSRLQDAARNLPVPPPEIEADYDQTNPAQPSTET